jgi:hypothetical protein
VCKGGEERAVYIPLLTTGNSLFFAFEKPGRKMDYISNGILSPNLIRN